MRRSSICAISCVLMSQKVLKRQLHYSIIVYTSIIILQQDRVFAALVSLISMAMLVSVSPVVKEIAVAMGRGEKRGKYCLHEYRTC